MSTGTADLRVRTETGSARGSTMSGLRAYFASDIARTVQTVLGLIWLLDGALQFQSFMYGKGFIAMLTGMTSGQPGWVASSVTWGAHTLQSDQVLWNTLFALIQVAIGLGLLYRRTVKPALVLSFFWALVVWWFGEAFGMLFMTMASPLTGAPGAVILYAIIGAIVWPNGRPGGLLGVQGARIAWGGVWVLSGWLWLEAPSSSANAISSAISSAPSGMSWLSTVQLWATHATEGNGLVFAIILALISIVIGLAVALGWHPREFLVVAIVLNLVYWVVGQGFGGIFQGGATDPNAGLLFVVFAYAMFSLVPYEQSATDTAHQRPPAREVAVPS